jgi:hypothetical protein
VYIQLFVKLFIYVTETQELKGDDDDEGKGHVVKDDGEEKKTHQEVFYGKDLPPAKPLSSYKPLTEFKISSWRAGSMNSLTIIPHGHPSTARLFDELTDCEDMGECWF